MSSQTTTTPHGPPAPAGRRRRRAARKKLTRIRPRTQIHPAPPPPKPLPRNASPGVSQPRAPHRPHRPHHHPHTQHHGVSRSCHPALSHASSRRLPHRRRTAIRKRRCRGNHPIVQSHNRDDNDGTTVRSHEKGDATLRLIRTDHLERAPPKAGISCDQAFSNYDSQEVFRLHAGV